MRSLWTLVRHFLGSLLGRGVLEDDGVEGVRGLVFGAIAGLLSVGFMLPRQFSRIYLELSYLPDPGPFRTALTADSLFMLTLPFLAAMAAAALVAPSMFPDDVDYLTLVPLPVSRRRIFLAKMIALAVFVGALILSLAIFAAIAFPMFTHQRWAEGHFTHRIAAHAVAAAGSGLLGFACVVAVQGLGTMWAPRRWLQKLAVLVPGVIVTSVILAAPFVLQLPTQRAWIAAEPAVLALFPPAWFAGLERVLLGIATPYWQRMAWSGLFGAAIVITASVLAYALLYRHFERLVLPPPRATPRENRDTRQAVPPMDVRGFAKATLLRQRLPLLLFLVFAATGAGLVTLLLLEGFLTDTFRWDEPVPPALLEAVIALPLVLMLTGLTGLKTAFLLPVQSRANWIFRVTDNPSIRARHLASVDHACLRQVVFPVLLLAIPLQIWAIGPDAWRSLVPSAVAGLTMAELTMFGWRRVPFTCSWIPGKRPLVLTLVGAIGVYLFVTTFLAGLIRLSLFSWPLLLTLTGVLLIITAAARHHRQRSWADLPLQFEDEPFRLQTLGLR